MATQTLTKALTPKQTAMLADAARRIDGSVMSRGHSWGPHATVTGDTLRKRGLLEFVKDNGYTVWRITSAGREALAEVR